MITHGFMGRQSDERDRGKFQEELSRLGAAGWELAMNLHREKHAHVIVFKAPRRLTPRCTLRTALPPSSCSALEASANI